MLFEALEWKIDVRLFGWRDGIKKERTEEWRGDWGRNLGQNVGWCCEVSMGGLGKGDGAEAFEMGAGQKGSVCLCVRIVASS